MPREKDFNQTLCADMQGFSLHAAVHCGAGVRQALEQLCRYITRPALANERVQTNAAGQVVLKLKTPWRDGTTHLVMSRLQFMQRHIDRQLCGIEFCERYVNCGSFPADQSGDLPAVHRSLAANPAPRRRKRRCQFEPSSSPRIAMMSCRSPSSRTTSNWSPRSK